MPESIPITQLRFPPGSVAFDADAFDRAIRAHGVRFAHWRGMPDPGGLVDRFDFRRPNESHLGASNGMVYTLAGTFPALFTGNSKELRSQTGGWIDASTSQITPTRRYCGCVFPVCSCKGMERVSLLPVDRLYLTDESILVPVVSKGTASATGTDRLNFPVVRVQDLVDSEGIRYGEGDFTVVDGRIRWSTSKRPAGGAVYSARYLMRPYWYVARLLHDTRVAQQTGRVLEPMQQAAMIQREYVHEGSEKSDSRAPDPKSSRQAQSPPDGGILGAR